MDFNVNTGLSLLLMKPLKMPTNSVIKVKIYITNLKKLNRVLISNHSLNKSNLKKIDCQKIIFNN